jgi:hypothetical protein
LRPLSKQGSVLFNTEISRAAGRSPLQFLASPGAIVFAVGLGYPMLSVLVVTTSVSSFEVAKVLYFNVLPTKTSDSLSVSSESCLLKLLSLLLSFHK